MSDTEMKEAREQFFDGYGPIPNRTTGRRNVTSSGHVATLTGDEMLHRIDPRLRRLVLRACHNSYAAAKVVERLESFLIQSFLVKVLPATSTVPIVLPDGWWRDLLLERPTLTHRTDGQHARSATTTTAQFFFHPTLPTGGFHRLLLQAICQFHGWHVTVRTEENYECVWENGGTTTGTRVLTATGPVLDGGTWNGIRFLQHIGETLNDSVGHAVDQKFEENVATLRI